MKGGSDEREIEAEEMRGMREGERGKEEGWSSERGNIEGKMGKTGEKKGLGKKRDRVTERMEDDDGGGCTECTETLRQVAFV